MSNIFFISDLHFGHKSAIKWRTIFDTIEEHDEHIIKQFNSVVRQKDIVYILGDISFRADRTHVASCLGRLKGSQLKVIPGNHDDIDALTAEPRVSLLPGLYKKYGYWFSHAPIHPLELRGTKNVHGHVHSKSIPDDRYINVCAETVSFTPLSLDELRSIS